MARPALHQSDLFPEPPYDSDTWSERLRTAFADTNLHSGFLSLAEQAIGACPTDPLILLLAAMAALLDERPQRALIFLKQLSKYASGPSAHLLHALALNQANKRIAARSLLDRNGLTHWLAAAGVFPGGLKRLPWLRRQFDVILDGEGLLLGRRSAARARVEPKTAPTDEIADRPRRVPPATVATAPPRPPPLPRQDIEIPFTIAFDTAPLLSAAALDMEQAKLKAIFVEASPLDTVAMGEYVKAEAKLWGDVIRAANITVE